MTESGISDLGPTKAEIIDSLRDDLREANRELQQQRKVNKMLVEAIEAFFNAWPEVEKQANNALIFAAIHGMNYTAPQLTEELDALRAALAEARKMRE